MIKVETKADVETHSGKQVAVVGTLKRVPMRKGPGKPWQATGIRLGDDTLVWVTYRDPPEGWDTFVDKQICVEAKIWNGPPPTKNQAVMGPHLSDWGAPQATP